MKPILWLYLFVIFSGIIFIYSLLNYFIIIFIKNNNKNNLKMTHLSWKW